MNIEETISQLESLYQRATGQKINPNEAGRAMNPNLDPLSVLEYRISELLQVVQDPSVIQKLQPWHPPICVWENEERIIMRLDLPSVSKEDIDISLKGNHLVISGIRKNLAQDAGFMPRLVEAPFGHFLRTVLLPFEAVTSDINSSMRDGVLEITLQKLSQNKNPKKMPNGKNPQ